MQSQTTQPLKRERGVGSFDSKDMYKIYQNAGGQLSQKKYSAFINRLNEMIVKEAVTNRKIEIPRFGVLAVYRARARDGRAKVAIDWILTKKYGRRINRTNDHSEGKIFSFDFNASPSVSGRYGFHWYFKRAESASDILRDHIFAGNCDYSFNPRRKLMTPEQIEIHQQKRLKRAQNEVSANTNKESN